MAGKVSEVTDSNFEEEVLKSSTPVLVDFWAPWCGPCKSIAPLLEEIAEDYQDKLKIVKVNVDENPTAPSKYDVRGIPNLVFFKDGKVAEQVVGALLKEQLIEVIDKVV